MYRRDTDNQRGGRLGIGFENTDFAQRAMIAVEQIIVAALETLEDAKLTQPFSCIIINMKASVSS